MILTLGDLHLGAWDTYREDGLEMQLNHVDKVLDLEEDRCRTVVCLGDIYDVSNPSDDHRKRLKDYLRSPRARKWDWIFFPGNHDSVARGRHSQHDLKYISDYTSEFGHVRVFDTITTIKLEGVPWTFLPWPDIVTPADFEGPPGIIVTHNDYSGMVQDNGTPARTRRVLRRSDTHLVVMGHYHRFQRGDGYFCPGTLYQMDHGETPNKGYGVIDAMVDGNRLDVRAIWEPLAPPDVLHHVQVTELADLREIPRSGIVKVTMHPGVKLPDNWRDEYSNVHMTATARADKSRRSIATDTALGEIPIVDNLANELKRKGHSDGEVDYVESLLR